MIVCGDDTLANRLAAELYELYGERVVLVVPPAHTPATTSEPASGGRAMAAALMDRALAMMSRNAQDARNAGANGEPGRDGTARDGTARNSGARNGPARPGARDGAGRPPRPRVLEAPALDDAALSAAGVPEAAALALVHEDDETNIRAALAARRINPRLRLVIRLYNRKLGEHLAALLDQAAAVSGGTGAAPDASTTVLSDADTAAPALVATAVAGTSRPVTAGNLILRAVERGAPGGDPRPASSPEVTLALLSSGAQPTQGGAGHERPDLLPDDAAVSAASDRPRMVLEAVTPVVAERGTWGTRRVSRGASVAALLSPRVRWSFAGACAVVLALAAANWLTTRGATPVGAVHTVLLDLYAINNPATGSAVRSVLQLLAGTAGLLLLPLVLAAVLEALGTFRTAAALRRPSRTLSGHVVLLGLGKIGTRVLDALRELGIPVVCVEADPAARGVAEARRLKVPTVIGDVTQEGVLEAAMISRASALLALTSKDTTNLEAALYGRSVAPTLRVALRLFDDDFASAVYRTLRAAYPDALTRSRSVSTLAAPAFAAAMVGRQIGGAISVERRVLLIATVEVAGHPLLEGRTVGEVFVPGMRRIVALAAGGDAEPQAERGGTSAQPGIQPPAAGYRLRPEDRVVVAVTRRGLAELLARQAVSGGPGAAGT